MLGAGRVVGTVASARRLAAARAFGYDDVVVRDRLPARAAELGGGAGFDVVVDPVGGADLRASFDALAPGGRLVTMGGASDAEFSADELWAGGKSVLGFNLAELSVSAPQLVGHALRRAVQGMADGELRCDMREPFALERAASAHRVIEAAKSTSKIVLAVSSAAGGLLAPRSA
jgi:NADPH2:quinone reductase